MSDGDSLVEAISKLDTSLGVYGDHGALSGLGDDDHPQYGAIAQNEAISGAWYFQQNLGIGIATPATYGAGGSPQILEVFDTDYSLINLTSSDTTSGQVMGTLTGVSSGLSGAEKRIGYVGFTKTDGSTTNPTGKVEIGTANGGTPSTKLEVMADGDVNLYADTVHHDSASDAYYQLDRGTTSDDALQQFMTAGITRWWAGMIAGSSDYSIYNDNTDTEVINIDLSTNYIIIKSDYILQDGDDNAQYSLDRGSTTYNAINEYGTAGTVKWVAGMLTGNSDYTIYNQNTTDESITIDATTNDVNLVGQLRLPNDDPPTDNRSSTSPSTSRGWANYTGSTYSTSYNITGVVEETTGDDRYVVGWDVTLGSSTRQSAWATLAFNSDATTATDPERFVVLYDQDDTQLEVAIWDNGSAIWVLDSAFQCGIFTIGTFGA